MPILENGKIEYTIPTHIRSIITPVFTAQFLKELHIIFGVGVEDTDLDYFAYQGGTSGWAVAFATTCRKLGLDELYKYYANLEWFDSDIFDGELEDILIEHKLILGGTLCEEIARQNEINADFVQCCDKCGKCYHVDNMVRNEIDLEIEGDNEPYVELICKSCSNSSNVTPLPFDINRIIVEVFKKSSADFFVCERCGKTHYNAHRGEKRCLHCEQMEESDNTNIYYRQMLEEKKRYKDRVFGRRRSE